MAGPRNRRQIRRSKKALRRSGSVKRSRARQKDWTAKVEQDWDELAPESLERVMPRDDLDRRKQIEQAISASPLTSLMDSPEDPGTAVDPEKAALVTAVAGMSARIERDGVEHSATIRGLLTEIDTGYINPVAVGDRVTVSQESAGSWAIEGVLPRRTVLARPDPFLAPRQQVVAANVDQILIVSSWREPDLWPELIDRYLIAAGLSEIEPIICVNKADLIEDWGAYEDTVRIYVDMGYSVLQTSAITGLGVNELRDILAHKLSVVVGLSGTGKSSLMAAVQPDLDIRIGEVSDAHRTGKHTTTQSALYRLDVGGYVGGYAGHQRVRAGRADAWRAAPVLP